MAESLVGDVGLFELEGLVLELVGKFKGLLLESVFGELVLLVELQVFSGELVNC